MGILVDSYLASPSPTLPVLGDTEGTADAGLFSSWPGPGDSVCPLSSNPGGRERPL